MEKIFDIAKDKEQSWGTLATAIDGNFEEVDAEVNVLRDLHTTEFPVPGFCMFIKEMYCSTQAILNTNKIAVSYNAEQNSMSFDFRNDNSTVAGFVIRKSTVLKSIVFLNDINHGGMFALFLDMTNWDKVSLLANNIYEAKVSETFLTTIGKPNIINTLCLKQEANDVSYEKNTGFRISTNGEIVSASENWFYSKPIPVRKNDVVTYKNNGNEYTAVISYTDSEGVTYVPCVRYTGVDPDEYTLISDRDGYISVCGQVSVANQYLFIGTSPIVSQLGGNIEFPIVDNLNTENTDKALSAKQGVILKKMITAITPSESGYNYNEVPLEVVPFVNYEEIKIDQAPAKWQVDSITGSINSNLIKRYDNINREWHDCVDLMSTKSATFTHQLNSPISLHDYKAFRCAIELGETNVENLGSLQVKLFSGNSIDSSHSMTLRVQPPYSSSVAQLIRTGWFIFAINAANGGINGGQFDATNVTHIGVYLNNVNEVNIHIFVAEFSFAKEMIQGGGAVIVIDNYNDKVPLMADYAFQKGIKLNLSIITNHIGGTFGPDTQATIAEINRGKLQGHFIFNHTKNHITGIQGMPEYIAEINEAENYMLQNGFVRGSRVVSVPSSLFPRERCEAYCLTNAQTIYHNWKQAPTAAISGAEGCTINYSWEKSKRCLCISTLDSYVSDDAPENQLPYFVDLVRKGVELGGYAVIGFHGTFWSRFNNGEKWKEFIDAVAEIEDAKFIGIDELLGGQMI